MQTLFLILADGAQVVEGKLYLLGGGWNMIHPDSLPSEQIASLAIGLSLFPDETEQQHTFAVQLEAPQSGAVSEIVRGEFKVGRSSLLPEGSPQSFLMALPVKLRQEQPGEYNIRFSVAGRDMGSVPFWVVPRQVATKDS